MPGYMRYASIKKIRYKEIYFLVECLILVPRKMRSFSLYAFSLKWWHPFQHHRSRLRKPTFSWKRFIIHNQWEKVGLRLKLGETKSCGSLWRGNGQKAAGHQSCCRRLQGQIFRVITWSWNPPPPMEISTVGHRPRFAFTPSCNIKHLIYCRHNSSLVCETLLTLILLRFLTWAQKFPRLGFGGHTMQEDAGVKETFLLLAWKGAIDTLPVSSGLLLAVWFF